MTQLYFTGYWSRYDVKVRCFNSDGLPINTGGDPSWSMDFFQNRIRESVVPPLIPIYGSQEATRGESPTRP